MQTQPYIPASVRQHAANLALRGAYTPSYIQSQSLRLRDIATASAAAGAAITSPMMMGSNVVNKYIASFFSSQNVQRQQQQEQGSGQQRPRRLQNSHQYKTPIPQILWLAT